MVFAGLGKYGVYILFPTAYLLYYEIDHVIVKWIMRQPCFYVLVLATVHNVAIYIYIFVIDSPCGTLWCLKDRCSF